jgi:hypothetical protein
MSHTHRRSVRARQQDDDMSRDTSQAEHADRRLWLAERCPTCGAKAGARCQIHSTTRRTPPATLMLHAARGWRQRPCPTCRAQPGEGCVTPRGRAAASPHTARLDPARGQLHARGDLWRALERAGAQLALVRFCGGGGRPGTLESVSIKAAARELAHSPADSELPAALAAPVWGRYGSFRGQPPIIATLAWNVAERSLLLTGTRGSERLQETLQQPLADTSPSEAAAPTPVTRASRDTFRDSPPSAAAALTTPSPAGIEPQAAERVCCQCGDRIAPDARPEARFCSKRCRQTASRARLRARSGGPTPAERCAWCDARMPIGLRPDAQCCSKRCRQAASRARLRHARD